MLDPLKAGLVASLGPTRRHLTGITLDAGIEIWAKRLQMLKDAIPSTTKAAFLGMRGGWEGSSGQFLRDAGDRLGISLVFDVPARGNARGARARLRDDGQQRPDAVLVAGKGPLANRQLIAALAEKTAYRRCVRTATTWRPVG